MLYQFSFVKTVKLIVGKVTVDWLVRVGTVLLLSLNVMDFGHRPVRRWPPSVQHSFSTTVLRET